MTEQTIAPEEIIERSITFVLRSDGQMITSVDRVLTNPEDEAYASLSDDEKSIEMGLVNIATCVHGMMAEACTAVESEDVPAE